jgi:hypothetical protein
MAIATAEKCQFRPSALQQFGQDQREVLLEGGYPN